MEQHNLCKHSCSDKECVLTPEIIKYVNGLIDHLIEANNRYFNGPGKEANKLPGYTKSLIDSTALAYFRMVPAAQVVAKTTTMTKVQVLEMLKIMEEDYTATLNQCIVAMLEVKFKS